MTQDRKEYFVRRMAHAYTNTRKHWHFSVQNRAKSTALHRRRCHYWLRLAMALELKSYNIPKLP